MTETEKGQELENYPTADPKKHKHGDIVKCPNCGTIGHLDCSQDGGLTFEDGVWEEGEEWFCVECCYDPLSEKT
jgi:hypothetical protein